MAIHYASLALVAHYFGSSWHQFGWLTILTIVSIAFALFEVGYISIQAARAMPSHFNVSTPFYSAMCALTGFGAVMALLPAGVFGGVAAIKVRATMSDTLRLAIVIDLSRHF